MGTKIVGCSFNSVEENNIYAEKFSIPFDLLCDTNREVGLAYEACFIPTSRFALRISYLINTDGTIVRRYPNVSPKSHGAQVARDLELL
jgi:peroxiredoxin Q/BCP